MQNVHRRPFFVEAQRTLEWFGRDMERVGLELRMHFARILREVGPNLERSAHWLTDAFSTQARVIERALLRESRGYNARQLTERVPERRPMTAPRVTQPGFRVPRPAY